MTSPMHVATSYMLERTRVNSAPRRACYVLNPQDVTWWDLTDEGQVLHQIDNKRQL